MRRCCLLLACLVMFGVIAAGQANDEQAAQGTLKKGAGISMALATVTSTAISPLVGVCVLGIWQYYRTPKLERDRLPLIQKPKFWLPVILLLLLIFLKDTIGGFAPLIKKPLDATEVLFVNHAALVLIAFPVVLEQIARVMGFASWKGMFAYMSAGPVVYAATAQTGAVHHAFGIAATVLFTVMGLTVTFVIWLVGHSFDVLVLISPFPFLDFLLKAARNVLFLLLVISAAFSPALGILLSLALILVSFLLFGWALRLSFFGTVFAWSLLRALVMDEHVKPGAGDSISAFTARVRDIRGRHTGRQQFLHGGPARQHENTLVHGVEQPPQRRHNQDPPVISVERFVPDAGLGSDFPRRGVCRHSPSVFHISREQWGSVGTPRRNEGCNRESV